MWHLFKKRNEYDVIHAADFDTVLPALLMKTLFRKKLIYDIYDFYVDAFSVPDFAKRFVKWLDFRAINGANAIILTNESRLEQIQGSSPKRVFYIHNSPEDVKLTDRQTIDCHYDISVAYVGVLQDFRLLNEIVDIFSGRPTWKLAIAGFGLLEREIRRPQLSTKI